MAKKKKKKSRKPANEGVGAVLAEEQWYVFLLQGTSWPRVLVYVGIQYSHFCPCPFTSDLEMRPQLEHSVTLSFLLLWFQTLVTSPLSYRTGLCTVERDATLKYRWDYSSSNTIKSSWPPNTDPGTQALSWSNPIPLPQNFLPSPLTSYALAKPVPSSLPPFPTRQQVGCDTTLVQAAFLSWLYNCDSLQKSSPLLFFAPLQFISTHQPYWSSKK